MHNQGATLHAFADFYIQTLCQRATCLAWPLQYPYFPFTFNTKIWGGDFKTSHQKSFEKGMKIYE